MLTVTALLAALTAGSGLGADFSLRTAPIYSSASIVNAASNVAGSFAPNTLATIYGAGLSWVTVAIGPADVGARLPTALPGAGVRVLTCGILSPLYYVSPTQINFLVPAQLAPGSCLVEVITDGKAGPEAPVAILAATPALFLLEPGLALAVRADGSLITRESPALPGDVVVLYGTGFGQTVPPLSDGMIPKAAAQIEQVRDTVVLLDGLALPDGAVFYVGLTPGFGGLYQVNLTLPPGAPADPEIVIRIGPQSSPPGIRLPLAPQSGNPVQPAII